MKAPAHLIVIFSHGFGCSCGHNRDDANSRHEALRLAGMHQLAVFVHAATNSEQITTTCFGCGVKITMPATDPRIVMHDYASWIAEPCPSCGRSPRDIVAFARSQISAASPATKPASI